MNSVIALVALVLMNLVEAENHQQLTLHSMEIQVGISHIMRKRMYVQFLGHQAQSQFCLISNREHSWPCLFL